MKFNLIIDKYDVRFNTIDIDESDIIQSPNSKLRILTLYGNIPIFEFPKNKKIGMVEYYKNTIVGLHFLESNDIDNLNKEIGHLFPYSKEDYEYYLSLDENNYDEYIEHILSCVPDGDSSSAYVLFDKDFNELGYSDIVEKFTKKHSVKKHSNKKSKFSK